MYGPPFGRRATLLAALSCGFLFILPAAAGVVVKGEGDASLELGARMQIQYRSVIPESGPSEDVLGIRRLRPYLTGNLTEHWSGKVEFDFGSAQDGDEVAVKDTYLRYAKDDILLTIGNAKHAFSREFVTSDFGLQLIEKAVSGDHNYGTPDRVLGLKLDGKASEGKVAYTVGLGSESHDPDAARMDFDTPVNTEEDWNQGWTASGRLDVHPLGAMSADQGDFHSPDLRFVVGASGFAWRNDGDVNEYTGSMSESLDPAKADLRRAAGVEVSAAFRGKGLSADAEVHRVNGKTEAGEFTGGLYRDGETDLTIAAAKAGYMVVRERIEMVAAWDLLDATNYASPWTNLWLGLNWYVEKHRLKFQADYRFGQDVGGVTGNSIDQVLVQAQIGF